MWWFYSTSDLYNHQSFFGVYLTLHTGSTGQTYMWKDKGKESKHLQKQKCFSHESNEWYRGGGQRDRVWTSCRKAAVSGQVVSLISVLNQQPPQLFPQLPPSDAHCPLSAATPQRENWSRHRSAKHRQRGQRSSNKPPYANTHINTHNTLSPPLSSSSCAHTVLTQTSLLMTYTRRKLNGNTCGGHKWGGNAEVPVMLKEQSTPKCKHSHLHISQNSTWNTSLFLLYNFLIINKSHEEIKTFQGICWQLFCSNLLYTHVSLSLNIVFYVCTIETWHHNQRRYEEPRRTLFQSYCSPTMCLINALWFQKS